MEPVLSKIEAYMSSNVNLTYNAMYTQNLPTVYPVTMFDAKADADALHKAIAGLGTDEEALTTILCHRSSDQRAAINLAYKTSYRMVIAK